MNQAAAPSAISAVPSAATLSVVVPLYNEAEGVALLHGRLSAVLDGLNLARREIVFVDDGSRDATFAAVAVLAADDPSIRAIRFARNFGKEAAMAAGLRAATGETCSTRRS
jgi:polyisoprenyl-phosphate glycosyltransferase